MPKLEIRLKEFFQNDDVDVSVDGKQVANFRGATTNMSTGLAGFAEAEVPAGMHSVEVALRRKPAARLQVDVAAQPFVYVQKTGDEVRLSAAAERESAF